MTTIGATFGERGYRVVFGFIKRLRRAVRPAGAARPPSAPNTAPPDEERPGKSWYTSSLDLHDGLEVSDADIEEVTVPSPLSDDRRKR